MKNPHSTLRRLVAALLLAAATPLAWALDIAAYDAATLARLQQEGKPVALHFHADWCPVCRAQRQVFDGWRGNAAVPGTLLVVDYDKEKPLRKALAVRTQSTLIVYRGRDEMARLAGDTDPTALRAALATAQ